MKFVTKFIVVFFLFQLTLTRKAKTKVKSSTSNELSNLQFFAATAIKTIIDRDTLNDLDIIKGPFEMCIPDSWALRESKKDEYGSFTFIQSQTEFFKKLIKFKVKLNKKKVLVSEIATEFCKDKKEAIRLVLKKKKIKLADIYRRYFITAPSGKKSIKGKDEKIAKGKGKGEKKEVDDHVHHDEDGKLTMPLMAEKLKPVAKLLHQFFIVLMKIPIMIQFKNVLKCINEKEKEVEPLIYKKINKFINDLKIFKTGDFKKTIVPIMVPLCQFKRFKTNLEVIVNILGNPTDEVQKQWKNFGSFIGELVNVFGEI